MKASTFLSALVVLVFFITLTSGTRYTVSFQGLVGRLCGAGGPSGCPDSPPPYVSSSFTATPSPNASGGGGGNNGQTASPSVNPSGSGVSGSLNPSGSVSSPTASPSIGSSASRSLNPSGSGASGSLNPSGSGASSSLNPSGSGASGSLNPSGSGASGSLNPSGSGASGSLNPSGSGASGSLNPSGSGASGSLNPSGSGASGSLNPSGSGASGSLNPSGSGASGSLNPSGSGASGSLNPSGSGASGSLNPSGSGASGSLNPSGSGASGSSCPVAPSCTPCLCASSSNFPSFSRPASSASSNVNSGSVTLSPSITASPTPNVCGPQYEAATTNSFGVGLLFDRTTWARDNNNPALFGALYAINQINAAGGIVIGGKNVSLNPVIYDTQGLPNNTVQGAQSLIGASCVSVIIGTDNSAARRAVQSAVLDSTAPSNAAPGLLLNPHNWAGSDVNAGVINFGANLLTNVRHAIDWAYSNNKTHIHLLGSDDLDSRLINSYARQYIINTYPQILIIGEDYIPVGASEFTAQQTFLAPLFIGANLFNDAVGNPCPNGTACTMALSTVYGQAANRILYSALAARYLTPNNPNIPYVVLSLRNSQYEFLNFTYTNVNNQLLGTNYLDQIDAVQNSNIASWKSGITSFVQSSNLVNDPRGYNLTTGLELRAYNSIRLWANAVAAAGTANPAVIRNAIANATFNAPNGLVSVNATSREATTSSTPFYVTRLTVPPLRGLVVTPLVTYNDPFTAYAPAVGNFTGPNSFSSVVNGINNYYRNSQNSTYFNIGLGWEFPAIPSPTS